VLFLVLFVAAWHLATILFRLPPYLVPTPAAVARAAAEKFDRLVSALALTAGAAAGGFAMSLAAGTVIAFAFSQSRIIRSGCYPYAIFLQTVPIVAIAPIIITWFGYGFRSVVLVSFVISLFPIITNATSGLLSVDRELLELFQLYNATRWQTFSRLRLPNSVPWLIAGARTSSGLAVIGAIVGEFFAGYGNNRFGLGYLIRLTSEQARTDELFAAVIASTVLGIGIFALVNVLGRTVLGRWSLRGQD
jgi:NitT/TauT family transport system permease protein